MKIKRDFLVRNIAGDFLLVPVGEKAISMNGLITTNEVGARIWELLPEADGEDEITHKLIQEYEIDYQTLQQDVAEFIEGLRKLDII